MRSQKTLLIQQLDKKIKPFIGTEQVIIPDHGWISAIRSALNMTLDQLGERLNMTRQGAKKVEEREANGSISIKNMHAIGELLDMEFVYGFVPKKGSIEKLVHDKAEELAKKIVLRTSHNMKLENQGNSDEQINRAIEDLTNELKKEINRSLWD
ncbi:MAG: mobile mystery protein A [Chitinophagales bacterium]|nr:mobile mystery protein A [Chitinophagales bacterium]